MESRPSVSRWLAEGFFFLVLAGVGWFWAGPSPPRARFWARFRLLQARAEANDRSLSGQLKHYARLAVIAEDNPDLPLSVIQGILEAQAELHAGLGQPYQWGVIEPSA